MTLILKRSRPNSVPSTLNVDQGYLRELVAKLAFPRAINTAANTTARNIIVEEFAKLHAAAPVVTGAYKNVYAGAPATATILVGAHYDSVPGSPGADDNASGVAVMLAVARSLAGHPEVMYAAFNCEEYGLAGSREFVAQLSALKINLQAVYILEMVGFRDRRPNSQRNPLPFLPGVPTSGDFLGVVTNQVALLDRILTRAGACNVPFVGLSVANASGNLATVQNQSPHLLRSDHTSFWEKNIPAAMLTDTAEFRNPNYHRRSDTPETLDYDFMAEIAKAVITTIL